MLPSVRPTYSFLVEEDVPRLFRLVASTIEQNAAERDIEEYPLVLDLQGDFRTYDLLYTFFNELFYARHQVKGLQDYMDESRKQFDLFMDDLAMLFDVHRIYHWRLDVGMPRHVRHLPRGGFSCVVH